jgi:hypothetical protein
VNVDAGGLRWTSTFHVCLHMDGPIIGSNNTASRIIEDFPFPGHLLHTSCIFLLDEANVLVVFGSTIYVMI